MRVSSVSGLPRNPTVTRSASCPTVIMRRFSPAAARPQARAPSSMAPGRQLGRHDGIHRFTVGQRKGLGLSTGIPLYVVGLDAAANAVTVGPRADLEKTTARASGVNWIAGTPPPSGARITAQIRHRHSPGRGQRPSRRRHPCRGGIRQPAVGDCTRAGARDLRRRRGRRGRVDRLKLNCMNDER